MATHTDESARSVALDRIDVPDNVRDLDAAHVQALAGSIAARGPIRWPTRDASATADCARSPTMPTPPTSTSGSP